MVKVLSNPVWRLDSLEGLLLLAATPFLFFPTRFVPLTILALLGLVASWLIRWRLTGRPQTHSPLNGVMLLWAATILVGILVSADPDLTLPKATNLLLGLAWWRYLALLVERREGLRPALLIYLAIGMMIILVGVLSANWRFEVPLIERWLRVQPPRLLQLPGGPANGVHTNELAPVLLFFLLPALAFLLPSPLLRRGKLLPALLFLLLLWLLLLTQSRSAWMGAVAGIVFLLVATTYVISAGKRWRLFFYILLLVALFVAVAALFAFRPWLLSVLETPPAETAIGTLDTVPSRFVVWRWAIVAIGDFGLTGTGLGTFRRVGSRLYPMPYSESVAHAHNIFLQVALDTGLPGLVAYVAILLRAVVISWRIAIHAPGLRPLALGLLSALVAFHVYGLTDALAPGAKPGIVLWMALGLLTGMFSQMAAPADSLPHPRSEAV